MTTEPLTGAYTDGIEQWQDPPVPPAYESRPLSPLVAPAPADLPYAAILHPDRNPLGAVSVGTASTGYLVGAREIPVDGPYHYVLPSHVGRRAHYAADELYDLMMHTGEALGAQYPGVRLPLGDASAQDGGDIRHHSSHNSGRDIDIPFLITDATGEPTPTTRFAVFGRSLRNGAQYFDVERNWFIVRTLMNEADGLIQWIFISRGLRQTLLDHAVAIGEPESLVNRAAAVMRQPADSSPHNDHFHVRLYCGGADRVEGCLNTGPRWAWAELFQTVHDTRVAELLRAMDDANPVMRLAAISFLQRMDGAQSGPELARRLGDQSPEVQLAILGALQQFRPDGVGREVVALIYESPHEDVRMAAVQTAITFPLRDAADMLVDLIGLGPNDRVVGDMPVCREAARALLDIQDPALVERLIPLLDSSDAETRELVALVLARTTGFSAGIDWRSAGEQRREQAIAEWREWYATHANRPQEEWLRNAFAARGYELPEDVRSGNGVTVLISALDESEPLGYLARQALSVATGVPPPPDAWSPARQREYWLNAANGSGL